MSTFPANLCLLGLCFCACLVICSIVFALNITIIIKVPKRIVRQAIIKYYYGLAWVCQYFTDKSGLN